MRTRAEYERVIALRAAGHTYDEIAVATGIGRRTVGRWLTSPPGWIMAPSRCRRDEVVADASVHATYAYLLGLYLGDGALVRMRNGVYKLEVVQDARYIGLIAECDAAMVAIGARRVHQVCKPGCVRIYGYSKHWPCLFPQHGPGAKHTRKIALVGWQQRIVDAYPRELLRGLVHSDGCRAVNRVWGGRYEYPRYFFSNRSADIHEIFRHACDLLGIRWRQNTRFNTNIARRDDVAQLDEFIGPKH